MTRRNLTKFEILTELLLKGQAFCALTPYILGKNDRNFEESGKKGKLHPLHRHWGSVQAVRPIRGVEVQLYPFMTTALEGGEWSASRPGRSLPPGKTRYPLYRGLVGPQGRSGQVRKISPPPGFDLQTVQPVAIR